MSKEYTEQLEQFILDRLHIHSIPLDKYPLLARLVAKSKEQTAALLRPKKNQT